jgi:type II secretory pathway component PulK
VAATDRGGFALVAVLWMLVLASALALQLHVEVLADQRAAANARAAARAAWAARGALARAEDALAAALAARAAAGAPLPADTLLVPALDYVLEGVAVHARVVDARAKVQLDLAGEGELRALFAAAGLAPDRAAAAAAAVAGWRAASAGPGGFGSVEALASVPGLTAGERTRVVPYLTVAGDGRINVNTAPPAVLRTLPGIGGEAAEAIAARRRRQPFVGPHEVAQALPWGARRALQAEMPGFAARAAFAPGHAEVVVEAAPDGSPVRARIRAVAVLGGGGRYGMVNVVAR